MNEAPRGASHKDAYRSFVRPSLCSVGLPHGQLYICVYIDTICRQLRLELEFTRYGSPLGRQEGGKNHKS